VVKVSENVQVSASPEQVWGHIGDPSALAAWHPAIDGSEVDGSDRLCVLGDGGQVKERITEHSDGDRYYAYEILESPLPIRDCSSRLAVTASDQGSLLQWDSAFEADGASDEDAAELISGIYRAGLDNVAQQLA
jgi:carbon monoxide dehydrogenase subunit G